jgi:outer membrane protein assembly factor BamA
MKKLLIALMLCAACDDEIIPPKTPPKTTSQQISPAERRENACKAKELPQTPARGTDGQTDMPQGNVARVEVEGASDDVKARAAIGIAAGEPVSVQKTQDAIRKLYQLGDGDDIRLEARPSSQGIVLHFAIEKRPAYAQVVIHGGSVIDAPELEKALHASGGAPYDPVALVSTRGTLIDGLRARGFADASLGLTGVREPDGTVDLCVDLHEGSKITIESVGFKGLSKLKEAEMLAAIDTDHGRVNAAGGIVDQPKLDEAMMKFAELFDKNGLAKANVVLKQPRNGDKVALSFEVDEGPVITLRRYDVKGDLITDASAYRRLMTLRSKDPFSRARLVADMQKIGEMHEKKGRKDVEIQPQTQVDDKNNTIDVVLVVIDPKKAQLKPPPPPPGKPSGDIGHLTGSGTK